MWYPERVLALADVAGLQALRTAGDIELDLLALGQRPETVAGDRRIMNEHVLATLLGNESEPLRLVEPLHCATSHLELLVRRGLREPRLLICRADATAAPGHSDREFGPWP